MSINDIQAFSTTAASNADIGGNNIAENCNPSGINDAMRFLGKMLREALANQGTDITAAQTTNIAATGTSIYAKITGTTTIEGFGTPSGNPIRIIQWGAATPVTYNGTSMILMGGASKTYAAGDASLFVHEGSGNWRELAHNQVSGKALTTSTAGKHKLWIPAGAMIPAAVNGADVGTFVGSSVAQNIATYDFDQTTAQITFFNLSMPSSWDEGTFTFIPVWTAASGTGGVVFSLGCTAFGNDDALDAAFGTTASSADTLITAGDLHRGPESTAITPGGTAAANDLLVFRIVRTTASGSDDLNADAQLIGIELYLTTNAAVDVA